MAVLARGRTYDRARLMKRAAGARKKRKHKKAIALYRQVMEREPENPEIHKKLAPLLAQTRQAPEALASYLKAAEGLIRQGFSDQAIGLFREAAGYLPHEVRLWKSVSEMEEKRGRKPDAVKVLLEGRSHFRSRKRRSQAIELLILARKLDPTDFDVSYDLACLLGKSGGRHNALRLLEELARRPYPRHLRRVRARQLLLQPGFGSAWLLLRVLLLRR